MSRAERLLRLMQELRRHRAPVSGAALALSQGISLRTLYRDIASLQAQGATIEGEAGVGYVLRPGFLLPPLMLSEEEVEALVLGASWVAGRTDARLAEAARNVVAKIASVLPAELRHELESHALLVPAQQAEPERVDLAHVRQAIRRERKLRIGYEDGGGRSTTRVVWPFALGYFDNARVLAAWCEKRRGFRHFRTDRIAALEVCEERYPARRQALLKEWKATHGIQAVAL